MLDEIRSMREAVASGSKGPNPSSEFDYTRGIFQTIGMVAVDSSFQSFVDG